MGRSWGGSKGERTIANGRVAECGGRKLVHGLQEKEEKRIMLFRRKEEGPKAQRLEGGIQELLKVG